MTLASKSPFDQAKTYIRMAGTQQAVGDVRSMPRTKVAHYLEHSIETRMAARDAIEAWAKGPNVKYIFGSMPRTLYDKLSRAEKERLITFFCDDYIKQVFQVMAQRQKREKEGGNTDGTLQSK